MVAVRVFGNDTTVGVAASQVNFQLNVFLPVTAYSFLQSTTLLSDVLDSFRTNCVEGIRPNRAKMQENVDRSLMLAAALNPSIGYENAAKTVKKAHAENISLKDACVALGFLTEAEFDRVFHPEDMT
jgi:fumarate hydratase class II